MTTELTVQAADNGILVSGEDFVQVIENTHNADGVGYDNLITELGKLLKKNEIEYAMNSELENIVKVKIEITKEKE